MTNSRPFEVSFPSTSPLPKLVRDGALLIAGSLLIAAFAQVQIPLPFSPVPITLQTLAVFLVAGTLGSKRGALSVALYLLEGSLGLPFFAGGLAGISHLVGPRGGYLVGFVAAAAIVGMAPVRSIRQQLIVLGVAQIVVYVLGIAWLARFMGLEQALVAGCLPFLVGDALKIAVAASTLRLSTLRLPKK